MKKLFNSKWLVVIGYFLILVIAFQIAIASLDRHMYNGIDVVKQDGNVLHVVLDDGFTGTDIDCLNASQVLHNVVIRSGYQVRVVPRDDEWVIFDGRTMTAEDLKVIIDFSEAY